MSVSLCETRAKATDWLLLLTLLFNHKKYVEGWLVRSKILEEMLLAASYLLFFISLKIAKTCMACVFHKMSKCQLSL